MDHVDRKQANSIEITRGKDLSILLVKFKEKEVCI